MFFLLFIVNYKVYPRIEQYNGCTLLFINSRSFEEDISGGGVKIQTDFQAKRNLKRKFTVATVNSYKISKFLGVKIETHSLYFREGRGLGFALQLTFKLQ